MSLRCPCDAVCVLVRNAVAYSTPMLPTLSVCAQLCDVYHPPFIPLYAVATCLFESVTVHYWMSLTSLLIRGHHGPVLQTTDEVAAVQSMYSLATLESIVPWLFAPQSCSTMWPYIRPTPVSCLWQFVSVPLPPTNSTSTVCLHCIPDLTSVSGRSSMLHQRRGHDFCLPFTSWLSTSSIIPCQLVCCLDWLP